MTFDEYQKLAAKTKTYPANNKLIYPALGLGGETGEVLEKIKKAIRDDGGIISSQKQQDIKRELGDVLWYVAALAGDLELSLDDIAQANLDKLEDRYSRGVIGGSGDNR